VQPVNLLHEKEQISLKFLGALLGNQIKFMFKHIFIFYKQATNCITKYILF